MKPICVECEVEFIPEKNGVYVAEMFQKNEKIYRLWQADMLKCPACDKKIIFGFGNRPIAEHFEGQGELFESPISIEQRVEELRKRGETVIRNLEFKWGCTDGKET